MKLFGSFLMIFLKLMKNFLLGIFFKCFFIEFFFEKKGGIF